MTQLHEQALESIYRQVLQRLINVHAEAQRQSMLRLAECLSRRHPHLEDARLVVVCSGERDGLLTLALLRATQLLLAEAQGRTFVLRVMVPLLPGLSTVDHGNLQRAFAALFLLEDDRVEVLAMDDAAVQPYACVERSAGARAQAGAALLRSAIEPSGPVGHACLLEAAGWLWRAVRHGEPSDVLVMAQSPGQLKRHCARARRLLRGRARLGLHEQVPSLGWLPRLASLRSAVAVSTHWERNLALPLNVHGYLPASSKVRWALAMQCLGMQVDPFSLRYGPLECQDPLLGAYLAAWSASCCAGDDPAAGLAQWLKPRFERLRREGMPVRKLAGLRSLCLGERAASSQVQRLLEHLQARYGVNQEQLCCLFFQPFAAAGARLRPFLETCHPRQAHREGQIRDVLQGQVAPVDLLRWLQRVSGLPLNALRHCYASPDATRGRLANAPGRPMLCGCAGHRQLDAPAKVLLGHAGVETT